jgi:pimeloyl-ACP methyl ester carboxylesterase
VPGTGLALAGVARLRHQRQVVAAGRFVRPLAGRLWNDLPYMLRQMATLDDPEIRRSFLATIHAVIDIGGQGINAVEKLHLAAGLPTLIVWGEHDRMIPSGHGRAAADLIPGSRFELIPGAGHYPHEDSPDLFVSLVAQFMATTQPRT